MLHSSVCCVILAIPFAKEQQVECVKLSRAVLFASVAKYVLAPYRVVITTTLVQALTISETSKVARCVGPASGNPLTSRPVSVLHISFTHVLSLGVFVPPRLLGPLGQFCASADEPLGAGNE